MAYLSGCSLDCNRLYKRSRLLTSTSYDLSGLPQGAAVIAWVLTNLGMQNFFKVRAQLTLPAG
jgi:hypothetical protein